MKRRATKYGSIIAYVHSSGSGGIHALAANTKEAHTELSKKGYIRFDSKGEAKRFVQLKLLEASGLLWNLELQPSYTLSVNGEKIATYRADFSYSTEEGEIVEDFKGFKTPLYKHKRKHFIKEYPHLTHKETGKDKPK